MKALTNVAEEIRGSASTIRAISALRREILGPTFQDAKSPLICILKTILPMDPMLELVTRTGESKPNLVAMKPITVNIDELLQGRWDMLQEEV